MKKQNKPKRQTSKVENRDQQTQARIQNFGCATCFRSRCVGELEGGILPYAEWTGNRQKIRHFGIVLSQFRSPWTVLGRPRDHKVQGRHAKNPPWRNSCRNGTPRRAQKITLGTSSWPSEHPREGSFSGAAFGSHFDTPNCPHKVGFSRSQMWLKRSK